MVDTVLKIPKIEFKPELLKWFSRKPSQKRLLLNKFSLPSPFPIKYLRCNLKWYAKNEITLNFTERKKNWQIGFAI